MLFSLRSYLRRWSADMSPGSKLQRRGPNQFRPVLESLEDRWLPATVKWAGQGGAPGNWSVAAN
jgi:hypothetical protein